MAAKRRSRVGRLMPAVPFVLVLLLVIAWPGTAPRRPPPAAHTVPTVPTRAFPQARGPVTFEHPFPAGPFADARARTPTLGTGTTYYLAPSGSDSNSCGPSTPCRQVARALALVGAGDTIELANGTYMGFNMTSLSGARGNPITLWAPGGDAVIAAPGCYIENCDNMYMVFCSWIVLDGLRSYDAGRSEIRIDRSDNITVRNTVFGNGTTLGANGANLFTDIATNLTIEFDDVYGSVYSHGIYLSAGYNGDGIPGYRTEFGDVIRNNVLYDNNWTGIQIAGGINETVEQNIFYGNGAGGSGAISLRGIVASRIVNNLIYNESGGGIILYYGSDAPTPNSGNLVAYNTVLTTSTGRYGIYLNGSGATNTLRDNILYTGDQTYWSSIFYSTTVDRNATDSDYNLLQNVMDPSGNYSLAQWQALGRESHSLAAAPFAVFVDATAADYHLAPSSPAIGAGIGIAAVPVDLSGTPRQTTGSTDIGCYASGVGALAVTVHATPVSGTVPLTVYLNSTPRGGVQPYTYDWNFDDGLPHSSTQNTLHTYRVTGDFPVRLQVTDSSLRVANGTVHVTVSPSPLVPMPSAAPLAGPAPLNVSFRGSASGGEPPYTPWHWDFGDGSNSSLQNPNHTFASAGTYLVSFTVTDSTPTSKSGTVKITVGPTPLVVTATASPGTGVAPLRVSFAAAPTGGEPPYSYAWQFGDGAGSPLPNPSHLYPSSGTYAAWLFLNDSAAPRDMSTVMVHVLVDPQLSVNLTAVPAAITIGGGTVLTASAHGGTRSFERYAWAHLPSGCFSANRSTLSCTPTSVGSWNVTVTVMDSGGDTGSNATGVEVRNTTGAGGGGGATAPAGGAPAWEWLSASGLLAAGLVAAFVLIRRHRPGSGTDSPPGR
ncbi:MAG: PKD domain-containing protein [Thermoplasmata archaeon]|nr:PKD domain-containing protein [Thermoplasmata archaeon]